MVQNSSNTLGNNLVKISDELWSLDTFINTQSIDEFHENAIIEIFGDPTVNKKYMDFIIRYRMDSLEYPVTSVLFEESIDKEQEGVIWGEIAEIYGSHVTRLLTSTKEEYQEGVKDIYKQCLFYLGDFKVDAEKDKLIIRRINHFINDTIQENFELTGVPVASEFMLIANFLRLRKLDNTNIGEDIGVKDSLDKLDIPEKKS